MKINNFVIQLLAYAGETSVIFVVAVMVINVCCCCFFQDIKKEIPLKIVDLVVTINHP